MLPHSFEDTIYHKRKDMVAVVDWPLVVGTSSGDFLSGTQQEAKITQSRSEARLKPPSPSPCDSVIQVKVQLLRGPPPLQMVPPVMYKEFNHISI